MSARKIEGQNLIDQLAGFSPVRAAGTMAAASLFILASTFMTGCTKVEVEKKVVAEAPHKAKTVTPFLRVVEGENGKDIGVYAEKNKRGKYMIVMTEAAYECLGYSFGGESSGYAYTLHRAFVAMQKLDAVCTELAEKPAAEIEPETRTDYAGNNLDAVMDAFARARADVLRAAKRDVAPTASGTAPVASPTPKP